MEDPINLRPYKTWFCLLGGMFSLTKMWKSHRKLEASHFLTAQDLKELWIVGCLAFLVFPPLNVSEVPNHCDNPKSTLETLPPPLYSIETHC